MKYVKVISDLDINIEKLRNAYENCTKNFVTDNPNLKPNILNSCVES